jgi:hypothetical protein
MVDQDAQLDEKEATHSIGKWQAGKETAKLMRFWTSLMPLKVCPNCGRTYSDSRFSFCLEDGALLSPPVDDDATVVMPLKGRWLDSTLQDLAVTTTYSEKEVQQFWKGLQSRLHKEKDLVLNKPSSTKSPSGKSAMSKVTGGFTLSAQIHPKKNSVDVNLTGGRGHFEIFAKLHKRRNYLEETLQLKLEWRLKQDGESWVCVRHDFSLSSEEHWTDTYEWLIETLKLFRSAFFPRIHAIQRRLERSKTLSPKARSTTRTCRIEFKIEDRIVHTSPTYESANTWTKIIAYARSARGGAPADLPKEAVANVQILSGNVWQDVALPKSKEARRK